jgi:uroporphyrinogen-III decarboxylase
MQNDRAEIKKMVLSMVETARMSGGYFLASGNDIGWNVPPEAIRYYLDITAELGYR